MYLNYRNTIVSVSKLRFHFGFSIKWNTKSKDLLYLCSCLYKHIKLTIFSRWLIKCSTPGNVLCWSSWPCCVKIIYLMYKWIKIKKRPSHTHSVSCFSNSWSHSAGEFLRNFVVLPFAVTDFLGKGSFFKELQVHSQKRKKKKRQENLLGMCAYQSCLTVE